MDSDSSHSIVVTVDAELWRSIVTNPEALCRAVALAVVDKAPGRPQRAAEIGVLLTDDAAIRALNRAWRNQDKPTNVLSFPSGEDATSLPPGAPWLLGDIALAAETVRDEAEVQGKPVADHLSHLVVHGVLHLMGHDHEAEPQADIMEHLEQGLLADLGVPDPYAEVPR